MPFREDQYTAKQRRAVELLCSGKTQTEAYGGAYSLGGIAQRHHASKASAFFRKPKIQALVDQLSKASARRCRITTDRITRELGAVAFASLPDLVELGPDGTLRLKALESLTEDQRRACKKLKLRTTTYENDSGTRTVQETEVELHGKLAALELLGRNLGMFAQRVVHDIPQLDYAPAATASEDDDG